MHDVYSCSSLPRLDGPPRNAHSTFQQVMSPAIADNLLAAVYVASSIVGAGENHAKPKTVFAVHLRCTVNSKKRYTTLIPAGNYPHYPCYFDSLAGWFPGHSAH